MLLLAFLLLPIALRAETEWNFGTYIATTGNGGTLKSIKPTCLKSSTKCSDILDYKSYKRFNIANVGLTYMVDHVFDKFDQLSNLSLVNNLLTILPEFVFSNLTNLRYLCLANNKISSFKNTFVGLKNLDYLDLSNNKLESFEKSYFTGIPRKTSITVKGNSLSSISTLTFNNSHELKKDNTKKNNEEKIKSLVSDTRTPGSIPVEVCYKEQKDGSITVYRVNILRIKNTEHGCNITEIHNGELHLNNLEINKFIDNWYRIDTVPVRKIHLSSNRIGRITREMLNNLPETVTTVDLSLNDLWSMEKTSIEDINIHDLKTNLSILHLRENSLKTTEFIVNLPSNLTELDLEGNYITEIAEGSFLKLKRLLKLTLRRNQLTILRYENLQDLSTLQYLDLSSNNLYIIRPDSFLNLQSLRQLDLSHNKLYSLFKGTFEGLSNIQSLNLAWNFLSNISGDTLFGMPDTLSTVILSGNEIKVLRANSFVRVPKQTLRLDNNNISEIEVNVFDLPTLETLDLNNNTLRKLNDNMFDGLQSLKRLSLAENGIEKINSNFWKHLDTVEVFDISKNLIKTLKNGDLSGMTKRGEGLVLISETPIETIQGGVFSIE